MKRPLADFVTVTALLIGAAIAYLRVAGVSPIVWLDTFNDQAEVQRCLEGSCTLTGVATSVPGQVHAVAWLELRTLLAWAGVGIDGTHLLMQALNVAAVLLVFALGRRLGGPITGALAVLNLVFLVGTLGNRSTALYNTSPLLFLGTVFAIACTAVAERPGVVSVALAALVAAVLSNVHLACVVTGASVVWVALLAPRRRFALALFGGTLFAVATVLIAPPSWLHDLRSLVRHDTAHAAVAGEHALQGRNVLALTAAALAAWGLSFASRDAAAVAYRRRAHGPLAVLVPFVCAFVVGAFVGLDANSKYLAHAKAACAVAAALPLGVAVRAGLRRLPSPTPAFVAEWALPLLVAWLVATAGAGMPADDDQTPTMAELGAVAHVLHDEHGWDLTRTLERLKTPFGVAVLTAFTREQSLFDRPTDRVADPREGALMLILRTDDLPDVLPPNWTVVRRSAHRTAALIFTQQSIDWGRFAVCSGDAGGEAASCQQTAIRVDDSTAMLSVPNLPRPRQDVAATLALRLPLRAPAGATEIFMPRMANVCGGSIATDSTGRLAVDADRRHATLAAVGGDASNPSTIDLQWHLGAPECAGWAYDGLPPFVIEADPTTVSLLRTVLERRER